MSAKSIKHKGVKQTIKPINVTDLDNVVHKYFWLIIPVLTLIYYISSRYSQGFYQDDEIAQFLNAIQFKDNPFVILGNNPKPGWKIFLVIPAMFGYQPVLIFNSLISALTVYLTYSFIRISGVKYAFAGAILLAVQSLFFDLSFRSYSEIFTAFCLILFLILYYKEFYLLSGLLSGFIFTIRQEIAVFCIILGIIFFIRKKYLPILAIGVFPVLYSLLGYLKTGDIFFVMTEIKSVASLVYNSQGVFHYFKVYIFIIGPVSLVLFLSGFFGFFKDTSKFKEYTKPYLLPYILFITIFGVQIWTMWNNGPNPGNWRYLLHISPIAAFFAVVGLNNIGNKSFRKTYYILTGVLFVLVLLFVSKGSDGFILLDTSDYTKALTIAGFFALTMMIPYKSSQDYLNKLSVAVVLLAIVFIAIDFTPKKLSPENQTVKTVAEFVNGKQGANANLYANHTVLFFFMDGYTKTPSRFKPLNSNVLEEAPVGSLLVWENHYGYRPEWGSDLKLESIQSNRNFKLLNQFGSLDRRFSAYVFEKIN